MLNEIVAGIGNSLLHNRSINTSNTLHYGYRRGRGMHIRTPSASEIDVRLMVTLTKIRK